MKQSTAEINEVESSSMNGLADMPSDDMRLSLEKAFRVFSEASEQLTFSYEKLQDTVESLTEELAIANGELSRQYIEKKNLSEHLETLVRALPGGVLVLDPNRSVETANLAAFRLLGADILYKPWQEIVERLTPTNTSGEWETTVNGKKKRLTIASSPFSVQRSTDEDGGNDPTIWELREILLIHDITESHNMRQMLASQQKLAAMGEMTASLAHQLRTPLAAALIYAGHLVKPDVPSDTKDEFCVKLLERLRALEKLMTDMLSYVRGESVFWEEFQAGEILEEIMKTHFPAFETANIELRCEDALKGIRLLGNRKRLESALSNLLENARQACLEMEEEKAVKIVTLKTLTEKDDWIIQVADNGSGISENHIERIFDPFYTTRSQGTGLGLAIVRNVARSHGGDIDVTSTPGRGSVFSIRLPIARRLTPQETL